MDQVPVLARFKVQSKFRSSGVKRQRLRWLSMVSLPFVDQSVYVSMVFLMFFGYCQAARTPPQRVMPSEPPTEPVTLAFRAEKVKPAVPNQGWSDFGGH